MSVVEKIIVMAGHRGKIGYNKRKNAENELLVSFCKGEVGSSVTLIYDNNIKINNPSIYLPLFVFRYILSFKGFDWLYHTQSPHLMLGYRNRNRLIRSFCRISRFNHQSRVNFKNVPAGTFCTFNKIMQIEYNRITFTPIHNREFCRLTGKVYANSTFGYRDEWLYAIDINTGCIIKTSDAGEGKINLRNIIINYSNNNNTRDNLPLPLKILFKVGIHVTGNWPKDNNDNIDLMADILWPENRVDVQNFFKKIPSIHDINYYGW